MITPIVGVITKATGSTSTGILFYEDDRKIYILDISSTSPFLSTELRSGMLVISVNDIPCEGVTDAFVSNLVLETVGTLTILAHHDSSTMTALNTMTPTIAIATKVSPQSFAPLSGPSAPPLVPLVYATVIPENNIQNPIHAIIPVAQHQQPQITPPGVAEGGVWGSVTEVGQNTLFILVIGCLVCCLPGLLILCCPVDKKKAYRVSGRVYDKNGQFLGSSGSINFIPSR